MWELLTNMYPINVRYFSNPYFDLNLKSTCDVNLLSKLSIIFKEWRVMNNVDRGGVIVLFILQIIYTDFCFVTRLIINTINKVQWVDFKLENVLVSLHSLKIMDLGPFGASAPLFLRNGELLGHSPIRKTSSKAASHLQF